MKEEILKEIKDSVTVNKRVKIIGFIFFSICFGLLMMMYQSAALNEKTNNEKYVFNETTNSWNLNSDYSPDNNIIILKISDNLTTWVINKYENIDDYYHLPIMIIISLIISITISFIMLPTFGTNSRYYFDEVNIKVNGVLIGKNKIHPFRITKISEYGNGYKINIYRDGNSSKDLEVEKWKVTPPVKKWYWF